MPRQLGKRCTESRLVSHMIRLQLSREVNSLAGYASSSPVLARRGTFVTSVGCITGTCEGKAGRREKKK